MFKQKKAFTLIELLVVIAIIGILATLAVVALQQARQNARDSKRMADVKQIHTALELYYNENNRYPTEDEWNSGTITSSSSQEVFMYNIPSAPTPADGNCQPASNTYTYLTNVEGSTYTIDFCTGKQVSDLPQGAKQMTPGGIVIAGGSGGGESQDPFAGDLGTFVDARDGKEYDWVKIGSDIWMNDNLNYDGIFVIQQDQLPCVEAPFPFSYYSCQIDNNNSEIGCFDNLYSNCSVYGGLYEWAEAMNFPYQCNLSGFFWDLESDDCGLGGDNYIIETKHQGLCPDGWHLPNDEELNNLSINYNNNFLANFHSNAILFWSSVPTQEYGPFISKVVYLYDDLSINVSSTNKTLASYVRCVKD